jgi:hypothetical protein
VLPRIVANALGGLMVEFDKIKLGLVEEGGYEVARAGHVTAVVCKGVRKDEKKQQVLKHQHPCKTPHYHKKTRLWGSSCVVMKSMRRTTRNKIKANVPWLQGNDNHGGDSYGRNMLMMK